MSAVHTDLDRLTAQARDIADDYAHRVTALADNPFPPGRVVPDGDVWRIHFAGRSAGDTEQLAWTFGSEAEARQALGDIEETLAKRRREARHG